MNKIINLEDNTHLAFFLILAFIGGFVDASSFVIFEVFTGHLTGNSVLSMIYLAKINWPMLLVSFISILGFFIGTLLGSLVLIKINTTIRHVYIICMIFLLQLIVFYVYFFANSYYSIHFAIFTISLSMGFQNGFFNKSGTVSIHSTYITGMTSSCISGFLKNVKNDNSKVVLFFLALSFVFGALIGGYLSVNYSMIGFSFILIPLLIAVIYSIRFKIE